MNLDRYLTILYADIEKKFRTLMPTIPVDARFEFHFGDDEDDGIALAIVAGDKLDEWYFSPGDDEYNMYWDPQGRSNFAPPLNEHGTMHVVLDEATAQAARELV